MELRWILVSVLLTALHQRTEACTVDSLTAKRGQVVTLPCAGSRKPPTDCRNATWTFRSSRTSVELITDGSTNKSIGATKDRLLLTEDCSLVINNVKDEDTGRYYCLRDISDIRYDPGSYFWLTVSNDTETVNSLTAKYGEDVTLGCENSGKPPDNCGYTRWIIVTSGKAVNLITDGKIREDVGEKKDRLRLTEDCSLVISHVKEEDVGHYYCLQDIFDIRYDPQTSFWLSVPEGEKKGPTTTESRTTERVTTAEINTTATTQEAPSRLINTCSLDVFMLSLRVFEVLLLTVITVLLVRAHVSRGSSAGYSVSYRSRLKSDGEDCTVGDENAEELSAPVRFHQSTS